MTASARARYEPPTLTEIDLGAWQEFSGVPRSELEARIRVLCRALVAATRLGRELEVTLRAAQRAGTDKHERLVALQQRFPHWECPACRAFNGEAKERLTRCRACGADRPG